MIKPFFFMEGLCSCVEFLVEQALILHYFMDINYDERSSSFQFLTIAVFHRSFNFFCRVAVPLR